MRSNQVKAKLGRGRLVVGSFLQIPSAKLGEILGLCGMDFLVIDQADGSIDIENVEGIVRACELTGPASLVRVPSLQAHTVMQALDVGSMGVHLSGASTVERANQAVSWCKYAPLGSRGLAAVRAADYGLVTSLSDYCETANSEVLVVLHIDDVETLRNLPDLLGVEGIDVYFLDLVDLQEESQKSGAGVAEMENTVDSAISQIVNSGKVAGIATRDREVAGRHVERGVRYVANYPLQFMAAESESFLKAVKD